MVLIYENLNFFIDYDAPITENGGYTPKYDKAAEGTQQFRHPL